MKNLVGLLEKLPVLQLLKYFPAFYGTWRFIIMFTKAIHWSLSCARSIQFIPTHLRSILILSTHLCLGLPSGLFLSGCPTNILYAFLFSPHSHYMLCPSNPSWLDHSNYTWYKFWSSWLCSFLQPPVTSSFFDPDILLSILYSNTLSICSSLNVRDQVPHPV
jgi:hypothetical protein